MPAHEEQPRLTRAEQRAALEKLKKEIYKPLLKRNGDNVGEDIHEKEKEKDQDTETCVICLEDFKPEEEVMLTPCNHMFHEDCIVPWVKSHGQCPICRLQFVRLLLNRNQPQWSTPRTPYFNRAILSWKYHQQRYRCSGSPKFVTFPLVFKMKVSSPCSGSLLELWYEGKLGTKHREVEHKPSSIWLWRFIIFE